jgi:hypothetical protein
MAISKNDIAMLLIPYNNFMSNKNSDIHQIFLMRIAFLLIAFVLISCQSTNITITPIPEAQTASKVITDVPTSVATVIPPTAIVTPPKLPAVFQTTLLNPLDTPHNYNQDTCQYLNNKWNEGNAKPGTVVMIIMLKGIYKGPVEETGGINYRDLEKIMKELKKQGFEAINTEQMLAFLQKNTYIPPRSVMIIQDDNHQYENYSEHFGLYRQDWGWPIVNGWISQPGILETVWSENIALENDGFVDHQPSGVMFGASLGNDSTNDIINRELQGSKDAFTERFGKNPIAFIWQGGGFGQKPVEAARKLNYQLGFTSNSRGPVMYNWVPLADELDPERPGLLPEGKIEDPLMTLPRYWPSEVLLSIDKVRVIGKKAAAYAEANKTIEIEYYNIVCAPTYGPVPSKP